MPPPGAAAAPPDGEEDVVLLATPAHLNINKISRELRRTDLSLHNCLLSIDADARFVARLARRFPALPVVANLRCGAWYTPAPDATAYFKSTDGHNGNWTFSTTRLNWHAAELAASRGGLLLVDATRSSTKRFPDALAKTVPIWAAVINWAVAEHRARGGASAAAMSAWRAGVALPPWVAEAEAAAIDARVPGWAAALAAVGADVAGLSAALAKPLRCLWLSQAAPLWALPQPEAMACTPLLCVSASAPHAGHGHRAATNQEDDDSDEEAAAEAEEGGVQPATASAAPQQQRSARAFSYVAGAGDDEEAWARGLTPALFWRHRAALLAAAEVQPAVDALVAAEQAQQAQQTHTPQQAPPPGAPAAPPLPALLCSVVGGAPALSAVATGRHDLPPAGTRAYAVAPSGLASPPLSAGGVRWLGDTRLGCASFAVLADPLRLWQHTDALLLCGDAAAAEATAAAAQSLAPARGALLCVRCCRAKADKTSLLDALPAAAAFVAAHLAAGRAVLLACPDGLERAPALAVALLAACFREEPSADVAATGPPRVRFAPPPPPQPLVPVADASKVALRRWLAYVSAHHPDARPTRGLLKQAFCWLRGGDDEPQ